MLCLFLSILKRLDRLINWHRDKFFQGNVTEVFCTFYNEVKTAALRASYTNHINIICINNLIIYKNKNMFVKGSLKILIEETFFLLKHVCLKHKST